LLGEGLGAIPGGNEVQEVLMRDGERTRIAARRLERGADLGEVIRDL
jgi:hypothetical protein